MNKTEQYKNLFVIVTGMTVLGLITKSIYFYYVAGGVGVISLVIPIAGEYVVRGWLKLAEILGWINSRIILAAFFFVILTPIALLSRIKAKNPLSIKRVKENSLYVTRNHKYTPEDLENSW
ncbi:MAG: SxtJ family membrane protein [Bacteroidetes bacterium]|nr:SxtJ family membrane protein [Bacteroidota bacterium]